MNRLSSGEIDAIARRVVQYLTRDFVDSVEEKAEKKVQDQRDELSFIQVMSLLGISREALKKRCMRKSIDFHVRKGKKFFYVDDIRQILPNMGRIQEDTTNCMVCEDSAV